MKFNYFSSSLSKKVVSFVLVGTLAANVMGTSINLDESVNNNSIRFEDYYDEDVKSEKEKLMRMLSSGDNVRKHPIDRRTKIYTKGHVKKIVPFVNHA